MARRVPELDKEYASICCAFNLALSSITSLYPHLLLPSLSIVALHEIYAVLMLTSLRDFKGAVGDHVAA